MSSGMETEALLSNVAAAYADPQESELHPHSATNRLRGCS